MLVAQVCERRVVLPFPDFLDRINEATLGLCTSTSPLAALTRLLLILTIYYIINYVHGLSKPSFGFEFLVSNRMDSSKLTQEE